MGIRTTGITDTDITDMGMTRNPNDQLGGTCRASCVLWAIHAFVVAQLLD